MDQQKLSDYAKLIIDVGLNIQEDEPLVITCPIEMREFGHLLAEHAYARKAGTVHVNWLDETLTKLKYRHEKLEHFRNIAQWRFEQKKYFCESGANFLYISAEDPELLKDMDPEKIQAYSKASGEMFRPLQHYTMNDILSWCVVAVANPAWAKKVFPEEKDTNIAVEKLWDAIFDATRMNTKNPLAFWEKHFATLEKRAEKLNRHAFRELHYQADNGTDLHVRLPKGHIWMAASSKNAKGTTFVPNMPTEEIFTLPERTGVNGTLVSTRPLSYNGQLIDRFRLRFEDGKVTEFSADVGESALKGLLEEHENAVYLGEVALVPHDSPISNSNILFYNTLFDENASCHFAFGASYPTNLKDGADMSDEELLDHGANVCPVHEDFMVGCESLSITGIHEDGTTQPIFCNGNFDASFDAE